MDDRIIQFRVGVLVVATCIITAILVVLFGELPRIASRQYTLYVAFKEAPGVTVDTPVRKAVFSLAASRMSTCGTQAGSW